MGYMPGGSLKDLIKKEGALSKERAIQIMSQISAGLSYTQKLIHRDLKPGNILFDDKQNARVCDMGFAKHLRSDSTASMSSTGGIVGTPAYMAPEIWQGSTASTAVDVYSCACILVEMLTGKPLFDGDSTPMVMLKHFQPLNLPNNLPEKWKPVIEKALEKEPEKRYQTVDKFADALNNAEKPQRQNTIPTDEGKPQPGKPTEKTAEDLTPAITFKESKQKRNKTPIYTGLSLFALFAVFFLIRACVFSARPEPTAEPEPPMVINTATKKPIPTVAKAPTSTKPPTSTPKPTSTQVKTATYANPYPDFETGICSINGVRDNCISKFTNTTTTFTAIFKSSILKSGTFILKINGVALDCKPYANLSGEFSCTGPRQNINTSLLLTISERQTNEELASAAIMLFVPTSKYGG